MYHDIFVFKTGRKYGKKCQMVRYVDGFIRLLAGFNLFLMFLRTGFDILYSLKEARPGERTGERAGRRERKYYMDIQEKHNVQNIESLQHEELTHGGAHTHSNQTVLHPGLREEESFAVGTSLHKLVFVFTVGCVVGYIVETIFCILWHGYWQTRQGMIWGPFSQIYGLGAVLMTLLLAPQMNKRNLTIFALCALIGGCFEFFCSVFQELAFGTRSWDFSDQRLHFGGRTSVLFMCLWGSLGIFFVRVVYPTISYRIERIPARIGVPISWMLIIFFTINLFVTSTAISRWTQRQNRIPPQHVYHQFLDTHFPSERMAELFPQMERVR